MRITPLLIILILSASFSFAQSGIDNILQDIEENNLTLKTLKAEQKAASLGNKTGIFLPDPELGILWQNGTPSEKGDKKGISFIQSFDFPMVYIRKSKLARMENEQLQSQFEMQKFEILLEARLLCLEIIYNNALMLEYEKRLEHAAQIAEAYSIMLEEGQANILDYNKAELNLISLENKSEKIKIRSELLREKLTALNGGIETNLNDSDFPVIPVYDNFEDFYIKAVENNPVMKWYKQQEQISLQQQKLQRSLNLPGFSAGYVSEQLTHERFDGISLGISIPLWENKNTIKYAKAKTDAIQNAWQDEELQLHSFLKAQHDKAASLVESVNGFREKLQLINSEELLKEAWLKRQINVTEYFFELSSFYESKNEILEMELELHQALAILNQYSE